jgi:hypothetical protein
MTRQIVGMRRDPLVIIKTRPVDASDTYGGAALSLAGWVVAAELLARMRDLNVIGAQEATAIIDHALSDLDESDLDELAEQLEGPLVDGSPTALGPYLKSWRNRVDRAGGGVTE